jgi:hypothetical protein
MNLIDQSLMTIVIGMYFATAQPGKMFLFYTRVRVLNSLVYVQIFTKFFLGKA